MKARLFVVILALLSLHVSAVVLFEENFSGDVWSEWSRIGANNGQNWIIFGSDNAGGSSPEARFQYDPRIVGEQELISPSIDTSKYRDLSLTFKYMVDHFANGAYTVGVKVYGSDGSETVLWSTTPVGNITASEMTVVIDDSIVDTDDFTISFFFSGDSYYIDFFFVDDVVLEADEQLLYGTYNNGDELHVQAEASVPVGETLILNPGSSVLYDGEFNITVEGDIIAAGSEVTPVMFSPAVAGYHTGHFVFYNHNSGGTSFDWCVFDGLSLNTNDPFDGVGPVAVLYNAYDITFSNCTFSNNTTLGAGGAVGLLLSEISFIDCKFMHNSAPGFGGATYLGYSTINYNHCLFADNSAQAGSVIYCDSDGELNLTNCTFTENTDPLYGTDILSYSNSSDVIDINIENTVWWNSSPYFIRSDDSGTTNVDAVYCNLANLSGIVGTNLNLTTENIISADPLWDAYYAPTWSSYPARDEYRSPLIDAGDPESDPDGDNTVSDIGYTYYDQGPHVMGEVSGIWSASQSPYKIGGPVLVPIGSTLTIEPGVEVLYNGPWVLTVQGAIEANGTDSDRISFGPVVPGVETGNIFLDSNVPGSSTFNACDFTGFNLSSDDLSYSHGAAIEAYLSYDITISNCNFTDNFSDDEGGALALVVSSAMISDCTFTGNASTNLGGAIFTQRSDVDLIRCLFAGNSSQAGTSIYFGHSTQSSITNCTFADNHTNLYDGDLYLYCLSGYPMNLTVTNSVWWDCDNTFIKSSGSGHSTVDVSYCDLEYPSGFSGANMTLTTSNINNEDPLWDDDYAPTWASCPNEDDNKSPLIDAGNLAFTDEDGTIADIGYVYFDQSRPFIAHVKDIPGDQGHQVQVLWAGSSHDSNYDFTAFYSLWRLDDVVRSSNDVIYDNAEVLMAAAQSSSQTLYLRLDDQYWAFIASIPATSSEFYIYNAPTLADSSTTGTHDATFMVRHHRQEGLWTSDTAFGHSVDNIAPDRVSLVTISCVASMIELEWSAVTSGSYEGNSYPELNGVWYKVYAGSSPDFECNPDSYLLTTQDPTSVFDPGAGERLFFKVIASDQP